VNGRGGRLWDDDLEAVKWGGSHVGSERFCVFDFNFIGLVSYSFGIGKCAVLVHFYSNYCCGA
jgi:hypothetical protein